MTAKLDFVTSKANITRYSEIKNAEGKSRLALRNSTIWLSGTLDIFCFISRVLDLLGRWRSGLGPWRHGPITITRHRFVEKVGE